MSEPMISTRFGRIICDDEVESELLERITEWVITYQAEVERQRGWAPRTLQAPASIIPMTLLERQPEDAFPCIAVSASQATSVDNESRELGMQWRTVVTVWADGADDFDTRKRVSAHVAAVRALIVNQCGVGPLVTNVSDPSTMYTLTDENKGRTIGAGVIEFTAYVEGALRSTRGGLRTPPADPYAVPAGLVPVATVNIGVGAL